ncbi:hypothetical protein [Kineosporia succinea]|uniref:DNA-directed RNA polymerase specialized sigma24 family protein n=1 Tax=Kineosporia succinea TaxID=84632 RepID=A0ABT9P905_9ACTN|nr:hypothetical protein [Kineosporia succinea]MDP9829181.1 DNA-directed RNA polymerase specialized sigma24 family protein [Kineosporia succinea]
MHDDVASIIAEIRRLAVEFPGERTTLTTSWVWGGLAAATVLSLPPVRRRPLALAARGYPVGQLAALTACSPGQAGRRLREAREELGVGERFGTRS